MNATSAEAGLRKSRARVQQFISATVETFGNGFELEERGLGKEIVGVGELLMAKLHNRMCLDPRWMGAMTFELTICGFEQFSVTSCELPSQLNLCWMQNFVRTFLLNG